MHDHSWTPRSENERGVALSEHVARIEGLDERIAVVGEEIAQRLLPTEAHLAILDAIPGIGRWSSEVILAAIGPDMDRIPTAAHLARWAGMCPEHDESAVKRRSSRTRKGGLWRRVTLTAAAYAAARGKGKKTAIAEGRTILALRYHLLSADQRSNDQRARRTPEPLTEEQRLIRQLEKLGHCVTLEPAA